MGHIKEMVVGKSVCSVLNLKPEFRLTNHILLKTKRLYL